MPVLWKVNTDAHIWRVRCLHSPLTQAGHFAERWSSFVLNQKHSRPECSIMKKHLTPESNYIPSAAVQETYKWPLPLGSKLWSLLARVRWGYVCQDAMTKLCLLFKGWGEERVIGEWRGCTTKKAWIITTRRESFISPLECIVLLKLQYKRIYRNKKVGFKLRENRNEDKH